MTDNDSKLILVVDDDPDFLDQMDIQLRSLGFRTVTADSQHKAEQILQEIKPDMAFLDLMMENLDAGFVLAHKIKKLDPAIPVILVTAVTSETGMEFDAATASERSWIKADAILPKPIRMEQLRSETERLLGR